MSLSLAVAEKLLRLMEGEILPASSAPQKIFRSLVAEGLISEKRSGRTKASLQIGNIPALEAYLKTHFSIPDLRVYIRELKSAASTRASLVQATTDSKTKRIRSFSGFLVNVYEPVEATLKGAPCTLEPQLGRFTFIHDYEDFKLPENITVIGLENPENFRQVAQQRYLFPYLHPLFVSRYPQNGSRDLVRWLQSIPNPYLHFGDFDFAGINIYLTEFKRHLGERARFFLPANTEALLQQWGNRQRYDKQALIGGIALEEPDLVALVALLHKYEKGLDQEALIGEE